MDLPTAAPAADSKARARSAPRRPRSETFAVALPRARTGHDPWRSGLVRWGDGLGLTRGITVSSRTEDALETRHRAASRPNPVRTRGPDLLASCSSPSWPSVRSGRRPGCLAAARAAARRAATRRPGPGSCRAVTVPLEGIDVSRWQGTINWAQVKAAGKTVRGHEGDRGDRLRRPDVRHQPGRRDGRRDPDGRLPLRRRPTRAANEAVLEADHYVAVAGLTAPATSCRCSISSRPAASAPAALQVWVRAWLDEVTAKLGIQPMVYVSPSFWSTSSATTRASPAAGYKLWIANWGVTSPTVPANNWSRQRLHVLAVHRLRPRRRDHHRLRRPRPVPRDEPRLPVTYNPTFSGDRRTRPASRRCAATTTTFAMTINRNQFVPPVTLSLTSPMPSGTTYFVQPQPGDRRRPRRSRSRPRTCRRSPRRGWSRPLITGVGGGLTKTTLANLTVLPALPDPPTALGGHAARRRRRTSPGQAPANDGGGAIASYTVTSAPAGRTCTATGAVFCIVKGLANGTAYTFTRHRQELVRQRRRLGGQRPGDAGPVDPRRDLLRGHPQPAGSARRSLKTKPSPRPSRSPAWRGSPTGAIAVTGNVTVVKPDLAGYVSVTSVATNAPKTSTLNFPAHDTRANAVTMPLGPGGKLGFTYVGKSGSSSAQIIFDVTGYFLPGASGASYFGRDPQPARQARPATQDPASPGRPGHRRRGDPRSARSR